MPACINSAISPGQSHSTQNGVTPEQAGALQLSSRLRPRLATGRTVRTRGCPFTIILRRLMKTPAHAAFRYIRDVDHVAASSRTAYQLQLSQTPVKDIAWLQVGQSSPILPSLILERASAGESARAAIYVLHARRACICSSVASSGVPRIVPSRHSKWPQPGSCRSLGSAPVRLPSRCTGYTTYLISACSTVPATEHTLRSGSRHDATL